MNAGINVNLHNRFDIEVRDAETNEIKQEATAYNIVLDAMWSRLVNRQSFMGAIHIGTGSGTLSPSRTTLFTFLMGRNVTLDSTSAILTNMYRRVKIQLEPSEYVGSTITEVGVAYGTTNTTLVTHAMLTDSEGNPISIEKTSTDVVIIYATVFFTVGELPSYVKLTGIAPNGNVGNNQVLAYLLSNAGSSIESNIRLGTFGDTAAETISFILRGMEVATKTATQTVDVASKKINFPIRRFEIAEANGHIQEFGIGGSFNMAIPNENYTGTQYDDVILTGQDGSNTIFTLASANIDKNTIVAKINNVETEVTIVDLPYYSDYFLHNIDDMSDNFAIYANEGILWAGDQSDTFIFQLAKKADGSYYVNKYSGGFGGDVDYLSASSELFMVADSYGPSSPGALFSMADLSNPSRTPLRTFSFSTSIQFPGYNPDNTAAFYVESIGSSNYNLNVFRYNGTAWTGATAILTLNAITSGSLAQSIFSPTEPLLFVGAGSNAGLTFRLYNYDYATNSMQLITFTDATENSEGTFSADGNTLVTFGKTAGVHVFEKISDVWTLTDIIPTTAIIYTSAYFVGPDCFVGWNSSSGMTVWKKIDSTWYLISTNFGIFSTNNAALLQGAGAVTTGATPDGHLIAARVHTQPSGGGRGMSINNWARCAIKFDTPPSAEDEIKVSYKVNGIHKTTNYVLDVSGYIQFGEG